MKREGLSAILGFHGNPGMIKSLEEGLEYRDYTRIDVAKTPEEMLKKCQTHQYDAYVMDLNLGYPNTDNFIVTKRIREMEQDRIEKGKVKFFPITANDAVVETAKREGIPEAMTKSEFNRLYFKQHILGKPKDLEE